MFLSQPDAHFFIPDQSSREVALHRVTHLAIGAHPDDIEIGAYHGIVECYDHPDSWFGCITMTNGSGSPRGFLYSNYSDEEMVQVRQFEQQNAAMIGKYSFAALLGYHSREIKNHQLQSPTKDLINILSGMHPKIIYTHNLADKHDTHIAAAIRVIEAIRSLPEELKPEAVYGVEGWRDLDWMTEPDQIRFDLSGHPNIASALIAVHDSQNSGSKRYDLGVIGRRLGHAILSDTHGIGSLDALGFGMDLTPLIHNNSSDISTYASQFIQRFQDEVTERIKRMEAGYGA